MRKLLFSKSQKKLYSDTVVRIGKNNLGFSLVELIIVIAIMAILVAVAIPVLGVFIEKAKIANDKQAVADIMYAIDLGGQSMAYEIDCPQISDQGLQIPVGFVILTNGTDKNGNAVPKFQILGSDANNVNKAAIEGMLNDALGTGYADFSLQYDSWGNSTTIPDLYADATSLYGNVKELSDILATFSQSSFGASYVDGTYENGVDAVAGVANIITTTYDEGTFIQAWMDATGNSGFGLPAREAYMAVRYAYNEALATYVEKNSEANHTYKTISAGDQYPDVATGTNSISASGHVSSIRNFGTNIPLVGALVPELFGSYLLGESSGDSFGGEWKEHSHKDPRLTECHNWICSHSDLEKLFGKCTDACFELICTKTHEWKTNTGDMNDDLQLCEDCIRLVDAYPNSTAAEADARAFYQMMTTMNDTANEAQAFDPNSTAADDDEWGYYDQVVSDFSSLYTELEGVTNNLDNCIVITVYQDPNGLLFGECNTPGISEE